MWFIARIQQGCVLINLVLDEPDLSVLYLPNRKNGWRVHAKYKCCHLRNVKKYLTATVGRTPMRR